MADNADDKKRPDPTPPEERLSVTHHRATIGGREIAYTATCGTLVLREESQKDGKAEGDKARASVFFVAYTLDGAEPGARPVTFSFNGGPGSSSVWLHLGLAGPKRVLLDEEGRAPEPPGRLVPNEFSLLDRTDLDAARRAQPLDELPRGAPEGGDLLPEVRDPPVHRPELLLVSIDVMDPVDAPGEEVRVVGMVLPLVVPDPQVLAAVMEDVRPRGDEDIEEVPARELHEDPLHPRRDHRPREPEEDGAVRVPQHAVEDVGRDRGVPRGEGHPAHGVDDRGGVERGDVHMPHRVIEKVFLFH